MSRKSIHVTVHLEVPYSWAPEGRYFSDNIEQNLNAIGLDAFGVSVLEVESERELLDADTEPETAR